MALSDVSLVAHVRRPSVAGVAARKRLLDIALGSILCLVALPVILLLAVLVAASLRAWPFFVQKRRGRDGGEIWIAKLRTLPPHTPKYMDKHTLAIADMKLPLVCRVLRETHLDELPQLFSVVVGHMSLVGPRPVMLGGAEPVEARFEAVRGTVRPGCAGLWQISSASGGTATSVPAFDLFYLYYASTRLDIWIMLRTVAWMLHLAKPIEIDDIPDWLRGPGLLVAPPVSLVAPVPATEDDFTAIGRQVPVPAPAAPRQPARAARDSEHAVTASHSVLGPWRHTVAAAAPVEVFETVD